MIIAPRFSLVQFVIDGISVVLPYDEAKTLKRDPRFNSAQIKPLHKVTKGRSWHARQPSSVKIMTAQEYAATL